MMQGGPHGALSSMLALGRALTCMHPIVGSLGANASILEKAP